MHSTPEQNRAHHQDLVWVKIGRSEYMRGDGVTIRKNPRITAWWEVFLPSGERPQMPTLTKPGEFFSVLPACAHSLTEAKYLAKHVTTESPVYVPRGKV